LKLNDRDIKYAGDFDEHPIPLIFISRSGCTPMS